MNPNFTTGLANAGVAFTATDASKTYPIETIATVPAAVAATQYPARRRLQHCRRRAAR